MKTIMIQNMDRIVRRADYDQLKADELLVTSVFRTIQGEGPLAGRPAVFLRLAGCNFGDKTDHCAGCDTAFQFDQGRVYSFEELLTEINALPGYSKSDILVVTGGEPTLQDNLIQFMVSINDKEIFSAVQMETNGTQAHWFSLLDQLESCIGDDDFGLYYCRPSIVVSPKASYKANRYAEPSELVKRYASCFKFVLSSNPDDPHHTVPEWALELSRLNQRTVYVSPMAVYQKPYAGEVSSAWDHDLIDAQTTAANYSYAAKYALENNIRLSIQQHLFCAIA